MESQKPTNSDIKSRTINDDSRWILKFLHNYNFRNSNFKSSLILFGCSASTVRNNVNIQVGSNWMRNKSGKHIVICFDNVFRL